MCHHTIHHISNNRAQTFYEDNYASYRASSAIGLCTADGREPFDEDRALALKQQTYPDPV